MRYPHHFKIMIEKDLKSNLRDSFKRVFSRLLRGFASVQ